jgi:hypothetical protein
MSCFIVDQLQTPEPEEVFHPFWHNIFINIIYFEIKKNQSLFKGMQVHVYLNLTLLLNKGIASRQVNEMKTTHVHVFSWIIPLTYFWKSFDYTLWICLVINSLWITFHVCLWLFQFGGWGYVNMNLVIFRLHMIDVYLCFCL